MSIFVKMCPTCQGDLLSLVDQDDFEIYKCAQCSREFAKENFIKNHDNYLKENVYNEI